MHFQKVAVDQWDHSCPLYLLLTHLKGTFINLCYLSEKFIYTSWSFVPECLYILVTHLRGSFIHLGHSSQEVICTSWSLISEGCLYILVTHIRRSFIHLGHLSQEGHLYILVIHLRGSFIHLCHSSQRVIYTSLESLIPQGYSLEYRLCRQFEPTIVPKISLISDCGILYQ